MFPGYQKTKLVKRIIRNQMMKTLKASPLNSRGSARPTEYDAVGSIDPEGVARAHERPSHRRDWGDPVGVDVTRIHLSGGTSYPRLLRGDAFSVIDTSLRINHITVIMAISVNHLG